MSETTLDRIDWDACRDQYRTRGFFVLDSVIPPAHLELLRSTCAAAIADMDARMDREGVDTLGINHRGRRYFVGQSYRDHPWLGEFLFGELMADICRSTLGDTAFLHNDQFVVKCEQAGMSFAWHQDGAYVQARIGDHPECITCWCTLDDVSEENGTAYILPADRFGKRELVEHRVDPATNDRIGYFGGDPGDPIVAPAGSIAVFSSLVFHRSGANPSGRQRRVYLAQYAPAAIRNAPEAFPQYFAEPFLERGRPARRQA
ncbi:MAG: phytanoyl-CoA dioxygenase family protein [Pirellulales bacterium]